MDRWTPVPRYDTVKKIYKLSHITICTENCAILNINRSSEVWNYIYLKCQYVMKMLYRLTVNTHLGGLDLGQSDLICFLFKFCYLVFLDGLALKKHTIWEKCNFQLQMASTKDSMYSSFNLQCKTNGMKNASLNYHHFH